LKCSEFKNGQITGEEADIFQKRYSKRLENYNARKPDLTTIEENEKRGQRPFLLNI
jgi:hypothetical protein